MRRQDWLAGRGRSALVPTTSTARDWLRVEDHCTVVWALLHDSHVESCYNIDDELELSNLEVVRCILVLLDNPDSLITFVTNRPRHDWRYAMDTGAIRKEVNWHPMIKLDAGIQATFEWYQRHDH